MADIYVAQANIDYFILLLETEKDPTKRAILSDLLLREKNILKIAQQTPQMKIR
jgi:hypothetical protein